VQVRRATTIANYIENSDGFEKEIDCYLLGCIVDMSKQSRIPSVKDLRPSDK